MNLPPEITESFALLNDTALVTDLLLKEIVPFVLSTLLRSTKEESLKDLSTVPSTDPIVVKKLYAALSSLFVEAAKLNYDGQQLGQALEEYKLNGPRVQFLSQKYDQQKNSLKKQLMASAFSFGHIVGVEWRLDYHVKSSNIEKVDVPIYMVSLKVEKQPKIVENITFYCTVEEMTDLVNKLRDATRQIERLSA